MSAYYYNIPDVATGCSYHYLKYLPGARHGIPLDYCTSLAVLANMA